ncbi:succinylglutamate desuccinylase [Kangiella marina]|uniref:Succinylglutamate desuccinylase n=1 Tax=Kangiella marina TaxID=1079178 RepID=A0ABP8IAK4_9GAMM
MNIDEFRNNFNLLDFVREHLEGHQPFSMSLDDFLVTFHDVGIIEFKPNHESQQYLALSAGVHGNETAPMEIVSDMVHDLLNDKLKLSCHLLVMIGHPKAMLKEQRFVDFNLNRMFSGEWKKYWQQRDEICEVERAKRLEQAVSDFFAQSCANDTRTHYDLHTAIRASKYEKFAIYPYLDNREHNPAQLNVMQDLGVNTVLLYHKPSTVFSYHSSHNFKADSITVELGKVKPFGENNREDFAEAEKTLRQLVESTYSYDHTSRYKTNGQKLFKVKRELLRVSDDSHLNVDDALPNFTSFEKGFELLSDPEEPYIVENDGEAIVFPNNKVPIGQRMALVVEEV